MYVVLYEGLFFFVNSFEGGVPVTYANMASAPTQTAGSSPLLASDWNTYVRDNFADIRYGHIAGSTTPGAGSVSKGTMFFNTSNNKLYLSDGSTSWVELVDISSAVNSGSAASYPVGSPVGAVIPFAGSSAPSGWLLCDGASYNGNVGSVYAALYNVITTTYGGSIGAFNVPDLQGRMVVGKGTHADVNALTKNDGVATVANRRPKHNHSASSTDSGHSHGVTSTQGAYQTAGNAPGAFLIGNGNGWNVGPAPLAFSINNGSANITTSVGVSNTTSGNSESPSYQVLNYIIKY